jgi:hypothetical protein
MLGERSARAGEFPRPTFSFALSPLNIFSGCLLFHILAHRTSCSPFLYFFFLSSLLHLTTQSFVQHVPKLSTAWLLLLIALISVRTCVSRALYRADVLFLGLTINIQITGEDHDYFPGEGPELIVRNGRAIMESPSLAMVPLPPRFPLQHGPLGYGRLSPPPPPAFEQHPRVAEMGGLLHDDHQHHHQQLDAVPEAQPRIAEPTPAPAPRPQDPQTQALVADTKRLLTQECHRTDFSADIHAAIERIFGDRAQFEDQFEVLDDQLIKGDITGTSGLICRHFLERMVPKVLGRSLWNLPA